MYIKQQWENLPNQTTPITAERLNHMEDGIEEAYEHGGGAGDTLNIGAIIPFSGTTAPNGYMICDGSAISRTTYAELFSVIGTSFGEGDGTTTFNLPNLKGKVPVGLDGEDEDFDTLGETGGEKTHTLTIDEIPSHHHSYTTSNVNNFVRIEASTAYGRSADYSANTGNTGGGQAHNILQPYTVINYIIKVTEAQTGEVLSETLPVGTELDYDGDTVPSGWEQVDNPEEYSTNEVKTNKIWLGKPVYRKVIYISNLPNNTQEVYDSGITEALDHVFVREDNSYYTWTQDNDYSLRQNITVIYYAKPTNKIFLATNTDLSGWHMYLTLEYTKVND